MPFPNPETQFRPGQSGNPNGYSRKRRATDALVRLIDERGEREIAEAWLGAALGDAKLLNGREPNAAFFSMMLERLEGKVPAAKDDDTRGMANPHERMKAILAERRGTG